MTGPQKAPIPAPEDIVITVPEMTVRIPKRWVRELIRLVTYLSGSVAVQMTVEALLG